MGVYMDLHAVIWEEGIYVIREVFTGVTTQGGNRGSYRELEGGG